MQDGRSYMYARHRTARVTADRRNKESISMEAPTRVGSERRLFRDIL